MKNLWKTLGAAQANITRLETKVLADLEPPRLRERALPFFESAEVEFKFGERIPSTFQTVTLVQDANRETRITQLDYSVELRLQRPGEPDIATAIFNSPFGEESDAAVMFDFDWDFEMGRTNTSYTNGRVDYQRALSRQSLGFLTNNKALSFSERNPLVMKTNEFFKVKIKPTLFAASSGPAGVLKSAIVTFTASGWRVLSSN